MQRVIDTTRSRHSSGGLGLIIPLMPGMRFSALSKAQMTER